MKPLLTRNWQRTPHSLWRLALRLVLLWLLSANSHAALQDHAAVREAARQFVATQHPWQEMETKISVGALDSRSRLRRCQNPLQAFLPPGSRVTRRSTIGVRCSDRPGWKLYLPVTVTAYATVLVARRPLPPGVPLNEGDVRRDRRDVASLGYGYISSLSEAGGYRTRRAIAQGAVITPTVVEAAVLIRRGQKVRLQSHNSAVNVSMAGEALVDGALGKRIRIRNLSSGKVVEGVVRSSEVVEIGY